MPRLIEWLTGIEKHGCHVPTPATARENDKSCKKRKEKPMKHAYPF